MRKLEMNTLCHKAVVLTVLLLWVPLVVVHASDNKPVPKAEPANAKAAEQIVEKNRIAAEVMAKQGVAIDDLFTFITPHLAKVQNPKDVHFNGDGYDLLGKQVAEMIGQALSK
jgi:lysophospholipase L1-like esterase